MQTLTKFQSETNLYNFKRRLSEIGGNLHDLRWEILSFSLKDTDKNDILDEIDNLEKQIFELKRNIK